MGGRAPQHDTGHLFEVGEGRVEPVGVPVVLALDQAVGRHGRQVEVGLGPEVAGDERRVHPGGPADRPGGGPLVAPLPEQGLGRRQQGVAGGDGVAGPPGPAVARPDAGAGVTTGGPRRRGRARRRAWRLPPPGGPPPPSATRPRRGRRWAGADGTGAGCPGSAKAEHGGQHGRDGRHEQGDPEPVDVGEGGAVGGVGQQHGGAERAAHGQPDVPEHLVEAGGAARLGRRDGADDESGHGGEGEADAEADDAHGDERLPQRPVVEGEVDGGAAEDQGARPGSCCAPRTCRS